MEESNAEQLRCLVTLVTWGLCTWNFVKMPETVNPASMQNLIAVRFIQTKLWGALPDWRVVVRYFFIRRPKLCVSNIINFYRSNEIRILQTKWVILVYCYAYWWCFSTLNFRLVCIYDPVIFHPNHKIRRTVTNTTNKLLLTTTHW